MPLTKRELDTALKVCRLLEKITGARWVLPDGLTPDDLDPVNKTPDTLAESAAGGTAAIEIRGLTGDDIVNAYRSSILSLEKRLMPSFGGAYELVPAGLVDLPFEGRFMRSLKSKIEKHARGMAAESEVRIPVSREAMLIMTGNSGPGSILCRRHNSASLWAEVRQRVVGQFFLNDGQLADPDLLDDAERKEFIETVVNACDELSRSGQQRASKVCAFSEYWLLRRVSDDEPGGVQVITPSRALDLQPLNRRAAHAMVHKAQEKFSTRRWADLHIIALDRQSGLITERWVREALSELDPDDLEECDLIVFVDRDAASLVWTRGNTGWRLTPAPQGHDGAGTSPQPAAGEESGSAYRSDPATRPPGAIDVFIEDALSNPDMRNILEAWAKSAPA